jgi:subtilase family serine protease
VDDTLIELDETVSLTIVDDPAYFVPGSATATVTIQSDEMLPDLDITSMSSPATASPGSSITITDTTKNIGGNVADESVTQFYLSADNAIDPSDFVLGSRIVPALATGVSNTDSTTVTIPESIEGGTWYIIAEADTEEVVLEDSEINNFYTRTIGVGPDLDITSLTVPATGSPGQSISISDTTKNKGAGAAGSSVTQFYLSNNSTIDASDTLLGGRSVPVLDGGVSSAGSTTVTIPEGTTTGKWYIIAKADGEEVILETVETNNTYVRSTDIGSNMDLNIPTITVPTAAGTGQSIAITDSTKNVGTGTVDPSVTQFYLSADSTIDASDTLLGSRNIPSLEPDAISTGSTTVTIPQSTSVGNWWIIAKADGEEAVSETSETNNTLTRTIGIGPDLDITSMSSPPTAGAGQTIDVSDTIQNIGGDIDATVTHIYLSSDNTIDASDTLLGSRNVPALAAGANNTGSTTATLPESLSTRSWYIIAKADGGDAVLEISETNNTHTRTIGIGPDLDITSLSTPAAASPGQSIAIADTTMNNGAGDVDPSLTQFYLSPDNAIDATDTLLGSRNVPALTGGESSPGSTTVTIPGSTNVGDWWIIAKADGEEVISETSESNNTYVRSITIGSDVDLNIAGLSAPTTASPGNSIVITDTTRNIGAGVASSSVTQFFHSVDSLIDASDVLLGSRSVPTLDAGASSVGSTTVTIPADTAEGNWWIIAKADGEETVSEALESNNTYARSISIGSDVDLDITYMSAPAAAEAGQSIIVTDTTKNIGDGTVGPTLTHFYLSANPSIDASDVLLGSRNVPALDAGARSTGSISVIIPGDTVAGSLYIIAKADGEELISESSENNNTYTRSIGIGPDLDITSFRAPSSANPGESITLTDKTMNKGAGVADPSQTYFYLSTNSYIDASDILIGSRSVPALAGGVLSSASTTVTIPEGTEIRRWFIIAKADGEDVVTETSESNNTYVRSIRIR